MKRNYQSISMFVLFLALISCQQKINKIVVKDIKEYNLAVENAKPGDVIALKNGIWNDVELVLKGKGTEANPITLTVEEKGKVTIEGKSNLVLGGEFLIVDGLHFKNGYTPTETVIKFRIDSENIANNSKVTNTVIENFTQLDRDATDHWIEFWGRNNELSRSYIAGKSNFGPTIMVMLKGNEHINNHHQIINNHFGPRPRKGGPHGETLQIGDSGTSMSPSYTNVSNNFFERCNGEVEIISSKSNYNQFKNNVFFESEGSLVLRHGNYATIDGNIFIGNDNSSFIGGIRVINTGHWITNNYFYKLKGSEFRASLAVMNGIPKSPLNRYNQVTDAVVAYNSWVDCPTPWYFSVGSNISKSDVLPSSEIRSARPIRTIVANNLIFNHKEATNPIYNYDKVDGVTFKNNITNQENKSEIQNDGIKTIAFEVTKQSEYIFTPTKDLKSLYNGFDFDKIATDIFGQSRAENTVGAITTPLKIKDVFNSSLYGTDWFSTEQEKRNPTTFKVHPKDLKSTLVGAKSGDIISLEAGEYTIDSEIIIAKEITITSNDNTTKTVLNFSSKNTAFSLLPEGKLHLENIIIKGNTQQHAFATLDKNMSKAYNLFIDNVEMSDFKSALSVSKGSFADTISVKNSIIKNMEQGFLLNQETNDQGDYNAEFVFITNNTFTSVQENVIDYYRGGYDESTIGGNLVLQNNTFTNCGKKDISRILIKNRGIVNVEFSKNTFTNNPVKLIAILWGEKGQSPKENTIKNSGTIQVQQNLKLKLMY